MPQKRRKSNYNGNQQNESNKNVKQKQTERQWIKKSENIFTNDELQEIKTILKRKHLVTNIPIFFFKCDNFPINF